MKTSSCVQAQFYKEQQVKVKYVCVCRGLYLNRIKSGRMDTSLFCSLCGVEAGKEGKISPILLHFFIIWCVTKTVTVCRQTILAVCKKKTKPTFVIYNLHIYVFNYQSKSRRLYLGSEVPCVG